VRPTLGKEPAAEDANPVGYLSGDTVIGLATFSYNLCVTPCLQTLRRLTVICLICLAAFLNFAPSLPAAIVDWGSARALRQQAWAIRITGTDLDAIPRYRFRAKTDKIIEAV
jgi:hypothetical protein